MSENPSMDDKDTPSPPRRTTAQYEADCAAGIVPLPTEPLISRTQSETKTPPPSVTGPFMKRHHYHPSVMHMGDCSVCGCESDHPNHRMLKV